MRQLVLISRLLIGIVFIYSGFVKIIDPLGTTYKFIDYFNAMGLESLANYYFALTMSFLMCAAEFILGIALFFNLLSRVALWGTALFMLLFTPVTLWLAVSNKVSDCGCFGDALIMTNWETFWKNVIIDIFIVLMIAGRKQLKHWIVPKAEFIAVLVFSLATFGFEYYNYIHLPMIDFRPYSIGTYIPDKMNIPADAPKEIIMRYYIMNNVQTKETRRVSMDDYMTNQEYWDTNIWAIDSDKTEDKIIQKGYEPPIHNFTINGVEPESGVTSDQDLVPSMIEDDNYTFLLVAYDLSLTNVSAFAQASAIAQFCNDHKYNFYALTAASLNNIQTFKKEHNINFYFYNTDPITLKTVIRANPGLVMLKKGTILNKWHYNDFPTPAQLETLTTIN